MDEDALERIRCGATADEMTVLAALREEIERLDPLAKVEVSREAGKEQLHLERGSGETGTASLHNLWKQLRGASGEAAAQAIEHFARAISHDFAAYERAADAASVMPMILSRETVESKPSEEPVCRELSTCGTLFVTLAFDAPDYVRYLNVSDLGEHGLGEPAVAEDKATANLASKVSAGDQLGVETQPILPEESRIRFLEEYRDIMVHRLRLDGDYDASLVLLNGLARHLCEEPESPLAHLDGPQDIVFALPDRGTLLIVDGREENATEALSLMARAIYDNAAYSISPNVYRYARTDARVMLEPVDPGR